MFHLQWRKRRPWKCLSGPALMVQHPDTFVSDKESDRPLQTLYNNLRAPQIFSSDCGYMYQTEKSGKRLVWFSVLTLTSHISSRQTDQPSCCPTLSINSPHPPGIFLVASKMSFSQGISFRVGQMNIYLELAPFSPVAWEAFPGNFCVYSHL